MTSLVRIWEKYLIDLILITFVHEESTQRILHQAFGLYGKLSGNEVIWPWKPTVVHVLDFFKKKL